jgi:hypothetical protein
MSMIHGHEFSTGLVEAFFTTLIRAFTFVLRIPKAVYLPSLLVGWMSMIQGHEFSTGLDEPFATTLMLSFMSVMSCSR